MTQGAKLYFQYSAVNAVDESELSYEVAYALAVYPDAPENLIKVDQLSTLESVYLKWDIVADYEVNVIGYEVWMERSRNGEFELIYDGKFYPGVNFHNVTGLVTGNSYRFKVASLNFNGRGAFTEEITLFSCLPPGDIEAPRYVSSTTTTMTLDWTMPVDMNGCPLLGFELYMDDGTDGSPIDTLVDTFEPQISQTTITSFTVADTSKYYNF